MTDGAQVRPVVVAELVAEAALAVPGVVELHSGALGEFATYGGGNRVGGVRVRTGSEPRIEARLVVAYGQPLADLGDDVRSRVLAALAEHEPALAGYSVDLRIVDVRAVTGDES